MLSIYLSTKTIVYKVQGKYWKHVRMSSTQKFVALLLSSQSIIIIFVLLFALLTMILCECVCLSSCFLYLPNLMRVSWKPHLCIVLFCSNKNGNSNTWAEYNMQFYLIKALHRSDRPFIFFPSFAPTCVICYYYSCSYNFRRDNEKQRSTSVHYHYHDHCRELNCICYVEWVRVHVRIVSTEPKEQIVSITNYA